MSLPCSPVSHLLAQPFRRQARPGGPARRPDGPAGERLALADRVNVEIAAPGDMLRRLTPSGSPEDDLCCPAAGSGGAGRPRLRGKSRRAAPRGRQRQRSRSEAQGRDCLIAERSADGRAPVLGSPTARPGTGGGQAAPGKKVGPGQRLCRAGVEPAGQRRKISGHPVLLPGTSPGAGSKWRERRLTLLTLPGHFLTGAESEIRRYVRKRSHES